MLAVAILPDHTLNALYCCGLIDKSINRRMRIHFAHIFDDIDALPLVCISSTVLRIYKKKRKCQRIWKWIEEK